MGWGEEGGPADVTVHIFFITAKYSKANTLAKIYSGSCNHTMTLQPHRELNIQ